MDRFILLRSSSYYNQPQKTIRLLLRKRVLKAQLADARRELRAWDAYLRSYGDRPEQLLKVLASPPLRGLLSADTSWEDAEYATNQDPWGAKTHPAPNGKWVRSKSEAEIAWVLYDRELPYRYEWKLSLGGVTVCPDFAIRDPVTGALFLWEHFGLMDHPDYARRAEKKLTLYRENGYFPGENLIITWEDRTHPLSIARIRAEIDYHFPNWGK